MYDLILRGGTLFDGRLMRGRLLQGITTEVIGNCGLGVFPVDRASRDHVDASCRFLIPNGARFGWETTGEYLDGLESRPGLLNVAALVPHNPIRVKVMEPVGRQPGERDLAGMRREVVRNGRLTGDRAGSVMRG